jgi:hypothetical protein
MLFFKKNVMVLFHQDQQFDPNIWSSSENKMLVKDEVYDLGYTPEWVQEIEQSYENQK